MGLFGHDGMGMGVMRSTFYCNDESVEDIFDVQAGLSDDACDVCSQATGTYIGGCVNKFYLPKQ